MPETNTWSGEWRSSRPGRGPAARLFAARLVAVVRPHLGFSAAPPPTGRPGRALLLYSDDRPHAPPRLAPRLSRVSLSPPPPPASPPPEARAGWS